ncbi:nucleotidyltransferase domain-containing protein [Rickettsiales endosymbiont of Peranema trichophorum]|uniref:nucleotidyltransferase family protein n=1 Tax=Rickettsiales endosymbiont of Peranema trichophorum TaxID=2486577 RepID=UPI001023E4D7|nr:nucleotidyltransferase domain-containing protein [Rickettsiales endosymbiont of Peranema trichophorum]RZI47675.1 nucleotidyltransferase domain-containing protein [Rickettsiales endosymbiont of Peranema trichophorum]
MNNKIVIDENDRKVLLDIFSKYPYRFYVYGSRVKGCSRRYSDIDICYFDDIPSIELFEIKEALEESNLTIKVDLLPVSELSSKFFKAIEKDLIEMKL